MTDLERDWDDLPVGPVPMDAILRDGRRAAARQQRRAPGARLRRSLAVSAGIGGLAAAFVAGTLVSSPGSGVPIADGRPLGTDAVPAAFFGELQAPESCDDLLAHYVDRGVDLVTAYGWGQPYPYYAFDDMVDLSTVRSAPAQNSRAEGSFAAAETPKTSTVTSSATGTNVQEAGVDEPDSVKSDGSVLVRVSGHLLTTYDVSGAEVERLGSLDLGDLHDTELLLAGDTVIALGNDGSRPAARYGSAAATQTRVLTIDIADPAEPSLEQTVDYDAAIVTARQHGATVRLTLAAGLPELDFVHPGDGSGGEQTALRTNRGLVEDSTLDDWLPTMSVDGGDPEQLLDCARVALPRAEIGLGTMAVVGFGAGDSLTGPDDVEALGLAGDASLAYESADHLYLATTGRDFTCFDLCPVVRPFGGPFEGSFAGLRRHHPRLRLRPRRRRGVVRRGRGGRGHRGRPLGHGRARRGAAARRRPLERDRQLQLGRAAACRG